MSDNLVICPNCVHQFRAISVSDQERIANLQAVVDAAKKAVKQYGVVYPIPSSGHWAMTELEQAIKKLEKNDDEN